MTLPSALCSAPGRPCGPLLGRLGLLFALMLLAGACAASDEAFSGTERDVSDQTDNNDSSGGDQGEGATGGDSGDNAGGGRIDSDAVDNTTEDELPFGDDGEEETAPEPFDVEQLTELSGPEEVIADIEAELPDDVSSEDVLDTIEPIDSDIDLSTDRQGRTTNEAGERVGLDESASLACANVEIALTAIDEGDTTTAAIQIAAAAERADASDMASVKAWSEPLNAAITDGAVTEIAPLIGFLSVCAEGGYEL